MPYNLTPIEPSKDVTGSSSLPLARVKKIIQADEDVGACSNNAAFAIAVATELFVQHLVEQTHNVVKSERRQRRNIQYKDVANAVARVDNLEFLTDVVPRTMTYGRYKEKAAKGAFGPDAVQPLTNGQRSLDDMAKKEQQDDVDMEDVGGRQGVFSIHDTPPRENGDQPLAPSVPVSPTQTRSPTSPRSNAPVRTSFDAVRDGYHPRPDSSHSMDG